MQALFMLYLFFLLAKKWNSYNNRKDCSIDGHGAESRSRFRQFRPVLPGGSVVVLDLENLRAVADLALDQPSQDVHVAADHGARGFLPGVVHGAVHVPFGGSGLVGEAVIAYLN